MSGTSLIILAMYSTVNVVTPGGAVGASTAPYLLAILIAAASLTIIGIVAQSSGPVRSHAKGASLRKVVRRTAGPAPRRH